MTVENIYQYIYLIPLAILLFRELQSIYYQPVIGNAYNNADNSYSKNCILLVLILTLFIGFRPIMVGSDTGQYFELYRFLLGERFQFTWDTDNLLFDNLFNLFGSLGFSVHAFFTFVAFVYFACIYTACRRLFPQNQEIAFLSYLLAFSTFSYGTDGIKAGMGASIFLVALAYKEKLWLTIFLALISIGIHHSMRVVAYAYILSYFIKNTKLFFFGWCVATIMAIAHVGIFQEIFANYTDEAGKSYLTGNSFMTGFRPDFILYSAMPILIGYLMYIKREVRDDIYELWLRMYLTTNSVWMLCMYASFTNRIAYLSWFLYPIVLLYPYFGMYRENSQVFEGIKVAKYHMWFTILMEVVYYGLLRLNHA